MMKIVTAGVAGLVFGLGLMLSGMAQPAVVLGFLDPLGAWNPALGFVMAGAIPVAALGFASARRAGRAVFDRKLHFPTATTIDRPLLIGAVIFGVGWGSAGICPAPALTLTLRAPLAALLFVAALAAGLSAASWLRRRADM
jgi:uncharacterized protein